jgi:hypothetical protein
MRERVSGLQGSDRRFFRSDYEWVVRGILLDYTPMGLYILDYRFPLFDFSGPRILTYSDRLSERAGYIEKGAMSEEEIIEFIMSSSEAKSIFGPDKPETVSDIIRLVDSKPYILEGSIGAKLTYASALLLDGQEGRATSMLDELQRNPYLYQRHPVLVKQKLDHYNLLRMKMEQGPAEVLALFDEVRRENLSELGVKS